MDPIPKYWIYKMYDSRRRYLGVLKGVTSEFVRTHEVNTPGPSSIVIEVARSADTASQPVKVITTEDGKWITTEDGKILTTEGVPPSFNTVGSHIKNGNIVEIWEYSQYVPNGERVYVGKIKRWNIRLGKREGMKLTVYPISADLNNRILSGAEVKPYVQLLQNGVQNLTTGHFIMAGARFSSTFPGIQSIKLKLKAYVPTTVTVTAYGVPNQDFTNPGTAGGVTTSLDISSTTATDYIFALPSFVAAGAQAGGTVGIQFNIFINGNVDIYRQSPAVNPTTAGYIVDGFFGTVGNELYAEFAYTTDETKVIFTNEELSDIVRDAMNKYIVQGGSVTYDTTTVDNTGIILPLYTFSVNTTYEVIKAMSSYSPNGFYHVVDPGSLDLTFKRVSATADITIIYGKHIHDLDLSGTIENIKNSIYFTGGLSSGQNIFRLNNNQTSIDEFGVEIDRLADNKVTDNSSADTVSLSYLDKNDDERHESTLIIPDSTMNTLLLKPGKTIRIANTGDPFIDSLIIPIVRAERAWSDTKIFLGGLPARQEDILFKTKQDLLAVQTVDNPNQPG